MSNYLALIDPSIKDNSGTPSDNLGDCIIYDSVKEVLSELFPNTEIVRVSLHLPFSAREKEIINQSELAFVGGTNILSSYIRYFDRMVPVKYKWFYLFPGLKNIVLLGTGWSWYTDSPDKSSSIYYKRILHSSYYHSLRDKYSETMLRKAFIKKTIFTGCPTTWKLNNGFINKFNPNSNIVFTLTDYFQCPKNDEKLLRLILNVSGKETYFFPQGAGDLAYLKSLQSYKINKSKFKILEHNIQDYSNLLKDTEVNYIGTRLHGGIRSLQYNRPTLIISIDNRAAEMGKDMELPIIEREDYKSMLEWIGNDRTLSIIKLPLSNIQKWKKQFTQT